MILILLGPPGGGKGTVAKRLHQEFNLPVISTGVILREEIEKKTKLGNRVQNVINEGKLVPDEIIIEIIEARITQKDCIKGYIFDGFPRNINQAKSLDRLIKRLNKNIDYVFYFNIPFEKVIERLVNRRVCNKCNINYNLLFHNLQKDNICDVCGEELYQREDDKEETIKSRLDVFEEQTLPLKKYYQAKNLLTVVDANLSKNAFIEIKNILGRL